MNKLSLIATAAKRVHTASRASFAKSAAVIKAHKAASLIIAIAVIASICTIGTAALTAQNKPVAMAPVVKKQHTPKQEKTEEVKSASTDTPTTPANTNTPTAQTPSNPTTPTTPAKPKAAAPQPKAYDRYANDPNPNAIKFIVNPQAARLTSPIRTDGPMTYDFDYTVQRDGTYGGPMVIGAGCYGSPGKPGDIFGSGGTSGVASLTVNYTAPNGVYSCSMSTDIGYTRFQTRFQIEINEEVVTILPGAQVVPGTRF